MCGIVGLYYRDPRRPVAEETIRAMLASIVHRGPDDEGLLVDDNLGMGMRRLSIIDLDGGHQPISNEDGHVTVVYNGEIYNYPELKADLETEGHRFATKSDTEVLVHGYEQWDAGLPSRLNGMFAYSLWDARRRRLIIARDRIGIKPLYIYEDEEKIAWASEIKALLQVPGITAEQDHAALFDFMTFGYVPAPRTMFRGIRKLPPASVITIEGSSQRSSSYWDLKFNVENRSERDWCEELQSLIDDAVRRQLMSDVPLGAFLSGGIDSSAIVSTMNRLGVGHIATYSIGFGGQDAFHNELSKASTIARQFETDHHEILVEPDVSELLEPLVRQLDEPFTDTSFIVTYLVSKLARETVKVILSGVGGDEVFAGYRRYLWPRFDRYYRRIPRFIDRGIVRPLVNRVPVDRGSRIKASLRYARGFLNHIDKPDADRYQGYVGIFTDDQTESVLSEDLVALKADHLSEHVADYYRAAEAADPLNRMLYSDLKTSLVDSLLAFTDKMSMAVSLEARVPLLDHRIVELAGRIPPSLKLRGVNGMKHIFKQAMSDRLPEKIIHQKKQGFGTPISRWFRGSLKPLLHDLLSRERIQRVGYFDPDVVWQLINDHMEQRADNSEHIMALLTFEIWRESYLEAAVA